MIITSLKNRNIFSRTLSLALSLSMVQIPGVSFGSGSGVDSIEMLRHVSSVVVPSDLGSVQESFQGTTDRVVIYVQDAHAHYEAQRHISGILEYLDETYGVNEVSTEGAEGPVDLTLFKALPYPEIKKEILDKDMRSGNTAGAEFFAMTSAKDIVLLGVDDDDYYLKNIGQYATLARKKEMYAHSVRFFQKVVDNLKSVMLSEEARAIDRLIKKSNRNHIAIDQLVKELSDYAGRAGVDLGDYPSVMELMEMLMKVAGSDKEIAELPKEIDGKKFLEELSGLKEDLLNVFCKDSETRELVRLDRYLELLRQGLDLELTPDDVNLLRRLQNEFTDEYLGKYLSSLSRKHRLNEPALQNVLNSGLDGFSGSILDFYETVEARDKIMVKNMKRFARRENPVSILVAGGFHTAGVTERLRQEKVSYVVIQPHIGTRPEEHSYRDIMLKWGSLVAAEAAVRTLIPEAVYRAPNWQTALNLAGASQRSLQPVYSAFAERVLAGGKMTPRQFAEQLTEQSGGKLFPLISPRGVFVFSLGQFYRSLTLADQFGKSPDEILPLYAARFPVKIQGAGFGSEASGKWPEEEIVRLERYLNEPDIFRRLTEELKDGRNVAVPYKRLSELAGYIVGMPGSIETRTQAHISLKHDLDFAAAVAGESLRKRLEEFQKNRLVLVRAEGKDLKAEGYYIPNLGTDLWRKTVSEMGAPMASSLYDLASFAGIINRTKVQEEFTKARNQVEGLLRLLTDNDWGGLYGSYDLDITGRLTLLEGRSYRDFHIFKWRHSVLPRQQGGTSGVADELMRIHKHIVEWFDKVSGMEAPAIFRNVPLSVRLAKENEGVYGPSPFVTIVSQAYDRLVLKQKLINVTWKQRLREAVSAKPIGEAEDPVVSWVKYQKALIALLDRFKIPIPEYLRNEQPPAAQRYFASDLSRLIADILSVDVAQQIVENGAARQETEVRDQKTEPPVKTSTEPTKEEFIAALHAIPYDSPLQNDLIRLSRIPSLFHRSHRHFREYHRQAMELLLQAGIHIPLQYREPEIRTHTPDGTLWVHHEELLWFIRDTLAQSRRKQAKEASYVRTREKADVPKQSTPVLEAETDKAAKESQQGWLKQIGIGVLSFIQSRYRRPSTEPFLKGKPTEADRRAVERPRLPETAVRPAVELVKAAVVSEETSVAVTETITAPPSAEPFREVTRAEIDEMTSKLASLDSSLFLNDAQVTFREIYEIFNPEELDDALLSQPQIRKLVESILENLRTLSNATKTSKTPSEASRLRGRLNYLRNRLAELKDREPAPVIDEVKEILPPAAESGKIVAPEEGQVPHLPERTAETGFGAATITPAMRAARYYVTAFPGETAQVTGFGVGSLTTEYLARALSTNPARARHERDEARAGIVHLLSNGKLVYGPGGDVLLNKLLEIDDPEIHRLVMSQKWDVAVLQNQAYPNTLNQLPVFISNLLGLDRATAASRFLHVKSNAVRLKRQLESIGLYDVRLSYLLDAREDLGNFVNALSPDQQAQFENEAAALQALVARYLIAARAISIAA